MSICVPIKELKNTAEFSRLVEESSGPVIVTKNGKEAFVSLSMETYDALCLEAARARLYQIIDRTEADIEAGRTQEAHAALDTLRGNYGLNTLSS